MTDAEMKKLAHIIIHEMNKVRRAGYWVDRFFYLICSECGHRSIKATPHCPVCGAEMQKSVIDDTGY